MKKKKSKIANQEKNKSIYLLIGLSLSMAFALEWLEWEDNNIQQHLLKSSMLSFIGDEPVLEFKSQPAAIPPKPKPVGEFQGKKPRPAHWQTSQQCPATSQARPKRSISIQWPKQTQELSSPESPLSKRRDQSACHAKGQ